MFSGGRKQHTITLYANHWPRQTTRRRIGVWPNLFQLGVWGRGHCKPPPQELHNLRVKRYRKRSHVSCPRESICLLRLMSGIGRRSSLCSVYIHELTRNAYDNLNYRSERRLKRLHNDSTMDLMSFTKLAREAGAISVWLVYGSNITVCEALALWEGEININKTSRSFLPQ